MKKLLLFVILLLVVSVGGFGWAAEKEVKYRVIVKLEFSALDSDATASLIQELTKKYSDACELNIEVKKPPNDSDTNLWYDDGSNSITITPGGTYSIPDSAVETDCTEGEDCK